MTDPAWFRGSFTFTALVLAGGCAPSTRPRHEMNVAEIMLSLDQKDLQQ